MSYNGINRREFFRGLGRSLALGSLLAGGVSLVKKPARRGEQCTSDGICSQCPTLSGCGLPQALSAKRAESGD